MFLGSFRDQLFEARIARECTQMPHKKRPDPLGLIGIDDDEGNLGLTGPDNNIAPMMTRASVFNDFPRR